MDRALVERTAIMGMAAAVDWYGRRDTALAGRLIEEINRAIGFATNVPFRCRVKSGAARFVRTRPFPYRLWYILKDAELVIVAFSRTPDGTSRSKGRAHAAGRKYDRTDAPELSASPRQRLSHLSMRKCLQHAGMLVPKFACRDNNGWHIQWPKDKPQVICAPTQADLVPLLASRLKDLGRVENVGPHVAPENACPTCR